MFQALHRQSQWEQDVTFRSIEPDIVREPNGYLYLPNTDPDIFQRLCDFLYQGVVPETTPSWVMEQKLYRLADLLGTHDLMNSLVDVLQEYHFRINTHFTIHQIRSICWDLSGSGVWVYCVMGMAYQLALGLYAPDDPSFDLLCKDYPQVSDAVILEVKQHVKDFHANLDYRQRGLRTDQGFGQCKFHVHYPGNYCQVEDFRANYPPEIQNASFLGRYRVESRGSLESEEADRILKAHFRHKKESGAAKHRRQRLAVAGRIAKRAPKMMKIRTARMPRV